MASPPHPVWAAFNHAQRWDAAEPTQEEYLAMLPHECRRHGLIGWKDELTDADILRAFPFDSYVQAQRRPIRHTDLTQEQWADPTHPVNNYEFEEVNDLFNDSDWDQKAIDEAKQQDSWSKVRKLDLERFAPKHLDAITANTKRDIFAAGGTQQRPDDIIARHPHNTILYWLAELWNLLEQGKSAQDPPKEQNLSILVLSDFLQEDVRVARCRIPCNETWSGFTSTMNQQFFVRYLVKKHNPSVAARLFVDDDTIWPPEGVLPFRDEDDNLVNPEQDHPRRADLVYDDAPGRGWWASVMRKNKPLDEDSEWEAIGCVEDWDSLMKWLTGHREWTAAFRHESVKERAKFVAAEKAKEDTVVGFPGYRAFNVHLDRHRSEVDQTHLYGPLREDSATATEDWSWVLSRDDERRQSDAAREIDALLQEAGITEM